MKDSGDPPPPPDPKETANAQSQANIRAAIANARLNRINQTTPWGSISYEVTGVDENGVPQYASRINLSPQQQELLNQQQTNQSTRSQIANVLLGRSASSMATPLNLSGLHSVYDKYSDNKAWGGNPQTAAQPFELQPLPQQAPSAAPAPAGMPAPGGPAAAPGSGAQPQIDPAMLAQLAAMLRGSSPTGGPAAAVTGAPAGDGAMPKGLDYASYLNYAAPHEGWSGGGDAGFTQDSSRILREDQWKALPDAEKFAKLNQTQMGTGGGPIGETGGGFRNSGDSADAAAFRAKFGDSPWDPSLQGRDPGYSWGYGELPTAGPNGGAWDQYAIDPSRVQRGADGRWVVENNNIKGDWLAHDQHERSQVLNSHAATAAAIIASAGLAGYLAPAAAAGTASGTGAGVTGGMGAEITGSQVAAGGMGSAAGSAGAGTGAGLTTQNTGLSSLFQGTPEVAPGAATDVGVGAGTGAGTGAGAPVTDLSVNATQSNWMDQIMQNLKDGKGALGLTKQQQLIVNLLPQLLRGGGTKGGK